AGELVRLRVEEREPGDAVAARMAQLLEQLRAAERALGVDLDGYEVLREQRGDLRARQPVLEAMAPPAPGRAEVHEHVLLLHRGLRERRLVEVTGLPVRGLLCREE